MSEVPNQGPLKGIRVLDMTSVVMGPLCTLLLASMGAEVIKLESPEGDINRNLGPGVSPGLSGTFIYLNNNKKSIAVDLRSPEGREVCLNLAATVDVFVHSIRPTALTKLGLAYKDISERKNDIIYCNLFGFGRNGEYFGKPAYDDTIQAVSGLAMLQAEMHDEPAYVTSVFADKISGISAAYAILAAIINRDKGGGGQEIDVPMFEVMTQCLLAEHATGYVFRPPLSRPVYKRPVSKHRKPVRTKDGYLSVIVYTQRHFERFFEIAEMPEVVADPRFAKFEMRTVNSEAYYALLGNALATKTNEEWLGLLNQAEIPCIRLNTTQELYSDPHLNQSRFFETIESRHGGEIVLPRFPIEFSKSPALPPGDAPTLSENADELLRSCGYTDVEIESLFRMGVVSRPETDLAGIPNLQAD